MGNYGEEGSAGLKNPIYVDVDSEQVGTLPAERVLLDVYWYTHDPEGPDHRHIRLGVTRDGKVHGRLIPSETLSCIINKSARGVEVT